MSVAILAQPGMKRAPKNMQQCALCHRQPAPGCLRPGGPVCRNHGCDCGQHRLKFGFFRGAHSPISRVVKLLGRLYLKALDHAMKYGRKAKLYSAKSKLAWQSDTIRWFADLVGVDGLINVDVIHEGPCVGLRSALLVRCYKRFCEVRIMKAEERRYYDDRLWEAWVGKRKEWEKDDDERWGRKDGDPPLPRPQEGRLATCPDLVSISSDHDDDDSGSSWVADFETYWPSDNWRDAWWQTSQPAASSSSDWEPRATWWSEWGDASQEPAWTPESPSQQQETQKDEVEVRPVTIQPGQGKKKRRRWVQRSDRAARTGSLLSRRVARPAVAGREQLAYPVSASS